MPIKIAMIGAGSIGFTHRLMRDVLSVPELQDTIFSFTDINPRNLDMVAQLCRRDIEANQLPARIDATTDRRRAIAEADYIVCTIRQGGLEAFKTDIDIPLQYGVDQCVGDTICAGGIMYAQRGIAALLDFCRDIREVAKNGALLLNYANPMSMLTWAGIAHGKVNTVGLCHGVQGAHWQITQAIEAWLKSTGQMPKDYVSPGHTPDNGPGDFDFKFGLHRNEVPIIAAGLNHQTWFIKVMWDGQDITGKIPELMNAVQRFRRTEKVRLDVLNRFRYYSTESNGHLSEYLPWYRKRISEIPHWIDMESWIFGETGGYLRVCTEGRNWFETDFPEWLKQEPKAISSKDRSEEHGSYIIEALETGRTYRGHFNVINKGTITNLPDGCVVEVPCYVDKTGIQVPQVGDLPLACAATCSVTANVQRLGVEAAVRGDVTLLKQAMLHDPLVGAVCSPEEVWQMTDEMLVAQAQWLPQYADHIEESRKRLAKHEKDGTRVRLMQTQGAARVRTKTIEEMARDKIAARANADAADKAHMTKH